VLKDTRVQYNIRAFRTHLRLPENWGVTTFEPKDFSGLAHLEGASDAMHTLETTLLNAVPHAIAYANLLSVYDVLNAMFKAALLKANPQIGLRPPEVAFAVAGFGDACRAYAYEVLRAHAQKHPLPVWQVVYDDWLLQTKVTATVPYTYTHEGTGWQVFITHTVYGRRGLFVKTPENEYDVEDTSISCPAEAWMGRLLTQVNQLIEGALI